MDQNNLNLVKVPDQGELFPFSYGATSLYTDADNVKVPPTLESLPRELQLQICRAMLRSEKPIILCPCDFYTLEFAFGSLGILRVSKYFSEMALSVMYGGNCFQLISADFTIEDECLKINDPDEDDLEHAALGNRGLVSAFLVLERMLVDF